MIKTTHPVTFLSLSQYELGFDLNNPYEVTEEDVWDVLGSIGGTLSTQSHHSCVRPSPGNGLALTCKFPLFTNSLTLSLL